MSTFQNKLKEMEAKYGNKVVSSTVQNNAESEKPVSRFQSYLKEMDEKYGSSASAESKKGTTDSRGAEYKSGRQYYSRPALEGMETSYQAAKKQETLLSEKRTSLESAQTSLEKVSSSLKFWENQVQLLQSAYNSAPNENTANLYNKAYGQYEKLVQDYDAAYSGYNTAFSEYKTVEEQYQNAVTAYNQQWSVYDDWRSTIRDSETVKADMDRMDSQIAAAESEVQTLKTTATRFRNGPLEQTMKQKVQEAEAKLGALESSRALLQEEYDWSRLSSMGDISGADDFGRLSADERLSVLDMMELQSWSKEDISMLESYVMQSDNEFWDMNKADKLPTLGNARVNANALFEKYGAAKVKELAESYRRYHNQKNTLELTQMAQNAANENEVLHSALSVGANLLNSISSPMGYLQELGNRTGRYSTLDPNNVGNAMGQYAGTVRNERAKYYENADWAKRMAAGASAAQEYMQTGNVDPNLAQRLEEGDGKTASTLYTAAASAADNLARILAGGGSKIMSLGLAATGSFGSTVSKMSSQGASPEQAITMGIIDGGLEIATEWLSIDRLFKIAEGGKQTLEQVVKNIFAQGGTEVIEEEIAFFVSTLAEAAVMKEKSSYNTRVRELVNSGYTEEQAKEIADRELLYEAGQTALQSFLSGGMMAGATSAVTNVQYGQLDKIQKQLEKRNQPRESMIADDDDVQGQNLQTLGVSFETKDRVKQSVIDQAGRLAQVTGRDIIFYSADATEKGIENGYYQDGKIYVNTRSGNALGQIVSHELTHSAEFAEAYKDLSKAVFSKIQGMGADLQSLRQQKQNLYAENGHALKSMTEVDQEIVAEFVEQYLLTDAQSILDVVQQNRTLGQRVVGWFDGLLAKLGNKNAQERIFLNNARNLWAKALEQTRGSSASTVQQTQARQPAEKTDAYAEGAKETLEWAREEFSAGRMTEEEFDALLEMVMQEEDLEGWNEYSFAGVNAKNANFQTLGTAQELEKQGVADETIRQQTGWFKGMDGKWRWEIDDSGMQYSARGDLGLRERRPEYARYRELLDKANRYVLELSDEALTPGETAELQKLKNIWGGTFRTAGRITEDALPTELLSDYVKHDSLFEAYPQLRKTRLRFADLPEGTRGQYDPEQDIITLSKKLRGKPQDTVIHEIQHVIQKAEGFAQGSSPEFWEQIQKGEQPVRVNDRRVAEAERKIQEILDSLPPFVAGQFELHRYLEKSDPDKAMELADLLSEGPYGDEFSDFFLLTWDLDMAAGEDNYIRGAGDLYQNTAGEIEARDVASRRQLTAEQRRNTAPARADDRTVFVEDVDEQSLAELDAEYGPQLQSYFDSEITFEEIDNNIRQVAQMEPVTQISGEEFAKGEKDLITQVEEFFNQLGNHVFSEQLGDVILDRKGVKSDIAHGIGRKKAAAFAAVPDVIEQGLIVDYQQNWKDRGYDTAVVAAPITIGTENHIAAVILTRSNQTNRFYVHEVLTTKNGAMPFKTGTQKMGTPSGDAPSVFSILDRIRAVKNGTGSQERFFADETGNQYSITATDKRGIASDLRSILNRGGNTVELRQYINHLERDSGNSERTRNKAYQSGSSAEQTGAQRIIQEARRQGLGVEEYLQQNWEQYDVDGEWNEDARAALDQERRGRRYSISETGEETQEQKTAEQIREEMPAKARNYLEGKERLLLTTLGEKLGVNKFQNRESLQQLIREISDEYLVSGRIPDDKMDFLFDKGFAEGIVEDARFYNEYKEIKDRLRTTGVTLSEKDQADIADFNAFRRRAFGTVRIVNDGLPVDSAYHELHEMTPYLFPESVTHPADQLVRMYEVGQSIRVAEVSLQHFYGPEAETYRKAGKQDFADTVNTHIAELRTVKRVADEAVAKAAEKALTPTTPEEAAEAYKQLKDARRTYEKAVAKNLLSESDEIQVGRLLKGEILPEHLDPDKDNVRAITAVYEAKQEYERLTKLIAEYKKSVRAERQQKADALLETANEWKDKKVGLAYSRETMERNIYDIVPDKAVAERVNREIFHPIHLAEADATRFKNEYRDKIRGLDLSRKPKKGNLVSEAHAVQLLGEAEDNIRVLQNSKGRMKQRDGKTLQEWQAVIDEMWRQSPDLNERKIRNAVAEFRKIYDQLFQQMNEVRIRNGYEPVNYRQGYFPHFQPGDGDGIMAHFGKVLGIDTQVAALPTTINGLTHTFRPGIQWFGNAQERLGFNTAYDAVEGFDKYIEGVASVIHQTDNIQMLRAMESQIRYRTTDEGIRKQVDAVNADSRLTEEEKRIKINDIYEHGKYTLSNFVTELTEYTNLLANKKSRLDRTTEALIGRRAYTIMKNWESRVGANMIAGNISSALTNFIPLTQAGAQLDTGSMLKGMWDTLKSYKTDDGFAGMSTFLTNRRGSDPLVQSWSQKASEKMKLNWLMDLVDGFTSDTIVRAAYNNNIKKGLSEAEAMYQADLFAANVMADRSKGAMPTLFESTNPLFKMFTQFQLEVNNQFSEVFKDLPRQHKQKGLLVLTGVLFKYFIGAFLFNDLYEYFAGRRPALDPFGMLNDTVGDWTGYELPNVVDWIGGKDVDFTTEKLGTGEAVKNLASSALSELPFSSGLTLLGIETDGGRVPASSAIPDLTALWDAATREGWSAEKRWKEAQDELNKLAYIVPPFGGNQVQKIWKGAKAYLEGGSYSVDAEGKDVLQYPVYNDEEGDFWSLVRAAIMGKSSLDTAQEWVEDGFDSLTADQTAVYQDMRAADVTGREAYALIDELRKVKKTEDASKADIQTDILSRWDISEDGKAIAFYGMVASESQREMMDQFADEGVSPGRAFEIVVALTETKKEKGEQKLFSQQQAIKNSGLTEEEKKVAVGEILGTEMTTEKGRPSQYANFLAIVDKGLSVDRYMDLRTKGVSMDSVIEYMDLGLTAEDAADLAEGMENLEPLQDADKVADAQRWRECIKFSDDVNIQLAALRGEADDNQYAKIQMAYDFGVNPDSYVSLQEIKSQHDADGNGSYTNQEIKTAIDSLPGSLTVKQKAVLWQLATGSKSAKNNPYSREVGQQIVDARAAAKEEE